MSRHSPVSTTLLLLRALVPSAIGIICYLLAGLIVAGAHALSLSTSGSAFPTSTNDTFMLFYANYIIGPLTRVLNSDTLSNGTLILFWGVCGWIIFEVVAVVVRAIGQLRETNRDISVPSEGVVVRHPLEGALLTRFAWRISVWVVAVCYTLAITPAIQWCLSNGERLLGTGTAAQAVLIGISTIGVWALIIHGYIIFLRLYLLRTRVFGELLY
jgi:hypothetical protein